jgi:hypothetical protein
MTKLIFGHRRFPVDIVQLVANCPKFHNLELLPYRVLSLVRKDSFHVFLDALRDIPPVITSDNSDDLFLLCEEFGFSSLLSKVVEFRSRQSPIDGDTWK